MSFNAIIEGARRKSCSFVQLVRGELLDALRSRFPGVSQTEVARQQLLRRNLFESPVPRVRQVLHQRLCQAGDQDHPLRSIHFSCHIAMSRCGFMRDQLARADAFTGTMGLSILIDGVVHQDRS